MGVIKIKDINYSGVGTASEVDTTIIEGSNNAVSGGAVYEALENKIEIIPILQADYDLLSDEEKNTENIIYDITDKNTDIGTLKETVTNMETYLNEALANGCVRFQIIDGELYYSIYTEDESEV